MCRGFFAAHAGLYGFTKEDLSALRVSYQYESPHNGVRHLFFTQEIEGIPVYGGMQAHVTREGELSAVSGLAIPGEGRRLTAAVPAHSAARAVHAAARRVGVEIAGDPRVVAEGAGAARETVLSAGPFPSDVKARLAWHPVGARECRLSWTFILPLRRGGGAARLYECVVDALTGEVRMCEPLTDGAQPARMLVFTDESPQPLEFAPGSAYPSPLPALPVEPDLDPQGNTRREIVTADGAQVTDCGGNPLVLDADGNPAASMWLPDGVMTTVGNNVDAAATDAGGLPQHPTAVLAPDGVTREFLFPLSLEDPDQGPEEFRAASAADLFFWCNYIHDRLHLLGFDESAGNFQEDNFGMGGAGGDRLIAHAHSAAEPDSSFISVPADGTSPEMEIGLYDTGDPWIDGAYDHSVVVHEYCHGLARRLVGGPQVVNVFPAGTQSDGLNEGWADWFAASVCARPGDPPDGAYPHAGYAWQRFQFGNRRYPYSTRLDVNPLRYRHLRVDPIAENPDVPCQWISASLREEHLVGEIWCTMLWEVRASLVQRHGEAQGVRAAERLAVDALKRTPPNPTFVEARDALLEADMLGSGGADRDLIWAAFAKRGLGYFADDGGGPSSFNVTEDACDPTACPGVLVMRCEGGRVEITVVRAGLSAESSVNVEVTSSAGDRETVHLPRVGTDPVFAGGAPIGISPAAEGDGTIQAANYGTVTATGGGAPPLCGVITVAGLAELCRHVAGGEIDSFLLEDIDGDGRVEILTSEDWDMYMGSSLLTVDAGGIVDVTASAGLGLEGWRDARWADYDNDGDLDLFAVASGGTLWENDGNGRFADATAAAGVAPCPAASCCAWADFEGDGDLDVFVGGESPMVHVNNGDGTFSPTTFAALNISYDGFASPISLADHSWRDGLPDILVWTGAAHGEEAVLSCNRGGGLFRRAFSLGGGWNDPWRMSRCIWGDYDNDGLLDLLMGTGSGDKLYRNDPYGPWQDCAEWAEIAGDGPSCESAWIDFDNDGFIDLVSAGETLRIRRNNGDGTFGELALLDPEGMPADRIALGNADGDPMPELFVSRGDELVVYKFPPAGNRHLSVKPMVSAGGTKRIAVGATVRVNMDDNEDFEEWPVLTRQIDGAGRDQMAAHFGVGEAELVCVRISYPDGAEFTACDVPVSVAGTRVTLPNSPPAFGPLNNLVINEGYHLLVPVTAHDPDGDPVTLSAFNLPPGAIFYPAAVSGTMYLEWTPSHTQGGVPPTVYDGIRVEVSDGAESVSREFSIQVRDVPQTDMIDNFEYGPHAPYDASAIEQHGWSIGKVARDKVRVVRSFRNHILSLAGDESAAVTARAAWPSVQGQYPVPRPKFSVSVRRGDAVSSFYYGLLIAKDTAGVTYYIYFYPWNGTDTTYVSGPYRYIVRYLDNGYADGSWDTVNLDLAALIRDTHGGVFSSIQRILLYGRCYADNVKATY